MPIPRLETLCFRAIDQHYPDLIDQVRTADVPPRYGLGTLKVYDQLCTEIANLPDEAELHVRRQELSREFRQTVQELADATATYREAQSSRLNRCYPRCGYIGGAMTFTAGLVVAGLALARDYLPDTEPQSNTVLAFEAAAISVTAVVTPLVCVLPCIVRHYFERKFARRIHAANAHEIQVRRDVEAARQENEALREQRQALTTRVNELDTWLNRE
jgi:hypothetical protein